MIELMSTPPDEIFQSVTSHDGRGKLMWKWAAIVGNTFMKNLGAAVSIVVLTVSESQESSVCTMNAHVE